MERGLARNQVIIGIAFIAVLVVFLLSSTNALSNKIASTTGTGTGSGPKHCGCTATSCPINPSTTAAKTGFAAPAAGNDEECIKLKCTQVDGDTVTTVSYDTGKGQDVPGTTQTYKTHCEGDRIFSATGNEMYGGFEFNVNYEYKALVAEPKCINHDGEIDDEIVREYDTCGTDTFCKESSSNDNPSSMGIRFPTRYDGCINMPCTMGGNRNHAAVVMDGTTWIEWWGNQCASPVAGPSSPSLPTYVLKGLCMDATIDVETPDESEIIPFTYHYPAEPLILPMGTEDLCPTKCYHPSGFPVPPPRVVCI